MLGRSIFLAGDKSSDGYDRAGYGLLGVIVVFLWHEFYVISDFQVMIILFADNARPIEKVLRAALN